MATPRYLNIKKIGKKIGDILYPPTCLQCGSSSLTSICPICEALFALPNLARCQRCGIFIPTPKQSKNSCFNCKNRSVLYIEAPLLHANAIAEAISAFKYFKKIAWAAFFAEKMYHGCSEYINTFDVICPVPLHRSRLRSRGFNQSEEIALHLAKLCNKPVENLLTRTAKTHTQRGLGRQERFKNLEEAFTPAQSAQGKSVLLLDDVTTTGTTLYKCACSIDNPGRIGGISITRRL